MNKVVTSKEALLQAAEEILLTQGSTQLSIRSIARKLDISVGAVYNYFPSKAELVLGVVENFWKRVFHEDICAQQKEESFVDFYAKIYQQLLYHMEAFQSIFLSQIDLLRSIDKEKGKAMEAHYFSHMREGFLYALNQDHHIQTTIWNETFTPQSFISFLFEHMMLDLSNQCTDVAFTKELICRLLYPKEQPSYEEKESLSHEKNN